MKPDIPDEVPPGYTVIDGGIAHADIEFGCLFDHKAPRMRDGRSSPFDRFRREPPARQRRQWRRRKAAP